MMKQATLNGTLVDDGGEACNCGFEWGETTAYGNTTPTQSRTTGQTFAQGITGLLDGIVYHFRAFATNSAGTAYGADRTFTTLPNLDQIDPNGLDKVRELSPYEFSRLLIAILGNQTTEGVELLGKKSDGSFQKLRTDDSGRLQVAGG